MPAALGPTEPTGPTGPTGPTEPTEPTGPTGPRASPGPIRRWRLRLPGPVAVLCWVVLAPLAALAVARLVAWDANVLLAEANSLNGLAYVPAWPVLLLAVLGRRGLLAGAAALVVVAQLAFAAPEVLAARGLPGWAARAPTIRLFDANVGSDIGNLDMSGFAQAIEHDAPEVVTLEEISPQDLAALESNGALAGLPYRYEVRGAAPWGFGIASRFPLRVDRVLSAGHNPFLVMATLDAPYGALRLWVVHTEAPPTSVRLWRSDLVRIGTSATATGLKRLLVVGDLNAGWGNAGFNAILQSGLVDAAAARGAPFAMTWPEGSWLPPLVRIDHLLTGSDLAVKAIATTEGPGSDHRALVGTIALRR